MCGAPVVMNMMLHAPASEKDCLGMREKDAAGVKMLTAGAPPPAAVIQGMESLGFDITHVYGLTEVMLQSQLTHSARNLSMASVRSPHCCGVLFAVCCLRCVVRGVWYRSTARR